MMSVMGFGTWPGDVGVGALGLLFRDDFNRADSASLGADWDVLVGSAVDISSNQLRINLPGANNDQRVGPVVMSALDEAFVQYDITDCGGNSQPPQIFGKWTEGTSGYIVNVSPFNNNIELFEFTGPSTFTSLGTGSQNWDAAETGYVQLYYKDSVQQVYARNTTDSTDATVAATDGTHTGTGYAGLGWGVGASPVGSAHHDDFVGMTTNTLTVTGMTSTYKAKVRNAAASVVALATESGGTATVNCSRYAEIISAGTGATEKAPYIGWEDIQVTDGSDVEQLVISGPIFPGSTHVGV